MYLNYVSILTKIKFYINLLINLIKKNLHATKILSILTYLSMFLVFVNLIKPNYLLISKLFLKLFGNKKEKSSSYRKYIKISSFSDNCSACKSSSKSSTETLSKNLKKSEFHKYKLKNKKFKVNKKNINKTLRKFKLD
jgi:hypothetical protein